MVPCRSSQCLTSFRSTGRRGRQGGSEQPRRGGSAPAQIAESPRHRRRICPRRRIEGAAGKSRFANRYGSTGSEVLRNYAAYRRAMAPLALASCGLVVTSSDRQNDANLAREGAPGAPPSLLAIIHPVRNRRLRWPPRSMGPGPQRRTYARCLMSLCGESHEDRVRTLPRLNRSAILMRLRSKQKDTHEDSPEKAACLSRKRFVMRMHLEGPVQAAWRW